MPSTRHVSIQQPSPASPEPRSRFTFPADHHLLVTTPSHILTWDSQGIHTVFKSSKSGIVAAKEAKDGSGVLAIADKRIIVLHDTKRGQERSWGLEADEDEVRHLEYTSDAKALFLSTSLTADIQRYSTEQSRLLSPTRAHASPPVALAVSSTGHLMVSASENPPVVYLKNLTHNSSPVLIESRASSAAVSVVSFHPERPNIFLLAFRDGTLAAFDASKICRNKAGPLSDQQSINAGETSRIAKLHRAASGVLGATAITDAAFLPGYKTRAITGGSDGRCRLVDFANGGVVLRTWHAQAPVTSISVRPQKPTPDGRSAVKKSKAPHIMGGPTSTDCLIAIGRADGKVHIYDTVGLLLDSKVFSEHGEKVISVEWVKGNSPKPISDTVMTSQAQEVPFVGVEGVTIDESKVKPSAAAISGPSSLTRRGTTFEHIGLPTSLRRPQQQANIPATGATRRFTIHPDEVDEGTVRRTPLPASTTLAEIGKGQYLDLFSPVKPSEQHVGASAVRRVASPPRSRPKLSPKTFVKSPDPTLPAADGTIARRRNLALFPSTDSGSETVHPSPQGQRSRNGKSAIKKNSPTRPSRHISFKPTSQGHSRRSSPKIDSFRPSQGASNSNARLLADLRKLGRSDATQNAGGVLSAFGAARIYQSNGSLQKEKPSRLFHRRHDHVETDRDSEHALKAYEIVHKRHDWPSDSNQDTSLDGDIWLTSESDGETRQRQRRRREPGVRPPARQTSRSRVDSNGTASTIKQQPAQILVPKAKAVDGSTEEEMWTAETHMSPSGAFSPSSNDVRELFPRSSSLSPRKRRSPQRKSHHLQAARNATLREIAPNAILPTQPKSPWARAKAAKPALAVNMPSIKRRTKDTVQVFEDPGRQSDGAHSPAEPHCAVCSRTQAKVRGLESEVTRLKGEVLALKSTLRRNDVPLPKSKC